MDYINNNDRQLRLTESNLEKKISESTFILKTKLYAPPLRNKVVTRLRLTNRLSVSSEHKLTLISAPAGYGKTTLTSEWLKDVKIPYSWLSLDDGDNDPYRFFTYLLIALQNIDDGIGEQIQGVFSTPQNLPLINIMRILINDITKTSKNFIVVLDDFHVIQNKVIHEAMQYLLDNMPPAMHIVLLMRNDPPLLLSRFRVRDQIIEITQHDLSFTESEVEEFLCKTMDLKIEKDIIKILEKRTEGWAAGLQLAGLNLKGMDFQEVSSFIDAFNGSNRYVFDYLVEEILNKLHHDINIFLYHTSILDRFNASLCDFIMGINRSKEILDYLEKMNLFLIPLDDKREWYRYHHLFSECLQTGLSTVEKEWLHLKAALWLEDNDFLYEAVEHAIVSKSLDDIERLIAKAFDETYLSTKIPKILQWLDHIPEERLLRNGNLSSYKAWCYFIHSTPEDALLYASMIEEQPYIRNNPLWLGRIMALRGVIFATEDKKEATKIAQRSIEIIGNDDPLFLNLAWTALGSVHSLTGNENEAEKALKMSMILSQKNDYHSQYISAAFFCVSSLNKQGRRREAKELCFDTLRKYKGIKREILSIHILYVYLGIIYYDNDDLVNAQKYMYEGVDICRQLNFLYIHNEGEWSLAFLELALGNKDEALKIVWEAQQSAQHTKMQRVIYLLEATEAYINFKKGDLKSAFIWAKSTNLICHEKIKPSLELGYFIYIHIILAKEQFNEAEILLNALECSALEGKRYGSLINIHILQSMLSKLKNNEIKALEYLKKAVEYAAPEGYYRYFLDGGKIIAEMLPKVRSISQDFIDKLLMKFSNIDYKQKLLNKEDNAKHALSERELEVLKLVALGLSNEDIGNRLFITSGTAKNHVANICLKLEVKKRTKAVIKAKELGYI